MDRTLLNNLAQKFSGIRLGQLFSKMLKALVVLNRIGMKSG